MRYTKLLEKYNNIQTQYKQLLKKCTEQEREIKNLRSQLAKAKVQIAKKETQNRRNLKRLVSMRSTSKNKSRHICKTTSDHLHFIEKRLAEEKTKGKELTANLHYMENEYCQLQERYKEAQVQVDSFVEGTKQHVPNTMDGHKFTNEIRELYYRLLAANLSPGRIENAIKIVLETFCPTIDTALLKLPKRTLAREMRSSELPTVAKAHEAAALSQMHNIHVHSDGTTLNQKKVQGYLLGGVTIGVTDVADGTALTAVEELDRLLHSIKEVGQELGLSNAEKVGWSLIQSLMSDQASTQKAFNTLVKERVEAERTAHPNTSPDPDSLGKEVLETFCGMHLGVNLRTVEVRITNTGTCMNTMYSSKSNVY